MKFNLNTALLLLLAVLTVLFLIPAENRNTLTAPHTLSLPGLGVFPGVPAGTYLLTALLLTALLFALANAFSRLRREADTARILRDMESLRANLDRAEGSRFAELQGYLDRRLTELQGQITAQGGGASTARLDSLSRELSADIGQLEEYLRRRLGE